MNEQDRQMVERVAKAINGPHDSSHIGIEELHKLQEYRWKRQTTKPDRARCLNQARAAISAMPDTTAQADTVTPQEAARVLLGAWEAGDIMPGAMLLDTGGWTDHTAERVSIGMEKVLRAIAGGNE